MGWVTEMVETLVEGRWVEARSEMGEGERGGLGGGGGGGRRRTGGNSGFRTV